MEKQEKPFLQFLLGLYFQCLDSYEAERSFDIISGLEFRNNRRHELERQGPPARGERLDLAGSLSSLLRVQWVFLRAFYLCLLQLQEAICAVARRDTFKEFSWLSSIHMGSCDLMLQSFWPRYGPPNGLSREPRGHIFGMPLTSEQKKPPVCLLSVSPDFSF